MKKYTVLFLMCLPTFLMAQTNYGIRIGSSFNRYINNTFLLQTTEEPSINNKFTITPDIGIFASFRLNETWSLQHELHYLQKGGRITEEYFQQNGSEPLLLKNTYNVEYLEIPTVIKADLTKKSIKSFLLLGASYGYALSQKLTGDDLYINSINQLLRIRGLDEKLPWDTDFRDAEGFNRHDWSGIIGLSAEKEVGELSVVLDLRYVHDWTDWRQGKLVGNDKEVQNRNIILSVGVSF